MQRYHPISGLKTWLQRQVVKADFLSVLLSKG
jgi:hypothetical protein